jgi:hypothetical protein
LKTFVNNISKFPIFFFNEEVDGISLVVVPHAVELDRVVPVGHEALVFALHGYIVDALFSGVALCSRQFSATRCCCLPRSGTLFLLCKEEEKMKKEREI